MIKFNFSFQYFFSFSFLVFSVRHKQRHKHKQKHKHKHKTTNISYGRTKANAEENSFGFVFINRGKFIICFFAYAYVANKNQASQYMVVHMFGRYFFARFSGLLCSSFVPPRAYAYVLGLITWSFFNRGIKLSPVEWAENINDCMDDSSPWLKSTHV